MSPASIMLFDLGGVIVHTRGFSSIKEQLAHSGRPEAADDQLLRDKWLGSPSVRDFELGHTSPAEFATRFIEEWGLTVPQDAFLQDLAAWIEQPYPGAAELLCELRARYQVCCFSNCNSLHWSVMTELLQGFDRTFSSHLLGKIKPDEDAFLAVLDSLAAEAADVIFFDDARANVLAAERLGIRAHLVGGPDDVRAILRRDGLL